VVQEFQVSAIARVIQLSVAPVFLLTGVGAMLGVMAARLARVIDRARLLEERLGGATPERERRSIDELKLLARRAGLIHRAVGLCTASALLVCAVIVVLFVGAFLKTDVSAMIGVLFVMAMLALFTGLVMFLAEIRLAIASMKIGPS
jgi:hypothetical protein